MSGGRKIMQKFIPASQYSYIYQCLRTVDHQPQCIDFLDTELKIWDQYISLYKTRGETYPFISYVFMTRNSK